MHMRTCISFALQGQDDRRIMMGMGHGHVVLIVEDDESISEALADLLEDVGFVAKRAADGRVALRLLCDGLTPCLILLDMMMPVMNGWELHEALRADPRLAHLPVCIVSACAMERAMPADAIGVLPKPVHLDRLLKFVQQHC